MHCANRVRRHAAWGAALLLWFLCASPLHAQDAELIAVLDFQPVGASEVEASAVTDRVREELLHTGRFKLVDRSQIEAVLNEQALQQTGCTEQECAVQVGQILGVRKMVAGKLTKISAELWQLSAMMVDVETTETIRAESIQHQGNFFGLLTAQVPPLAAKLAAPRRGAPPPPAIVAPIPAPAPMAPAPATAEPAAPQGPSRWAMWTGWSLLGAGLLMQSNALSTNADAKSLADQSRSTSNATLYAQAQDKRSEAESQQTVAFVLGGAGVGLLYYHYFSDGAGTAASLDGPPAGPMVALARHHLSAGWRWRW